MRAVEFQGCIMHVTCTPLRPGNLSVRVGDGSRRSEEIVKKSRFAPFNAIVVVVVINNCGVVRRLKKINKLEMRF